MIDLSTAREKTTRLIHPASYVASTIETDRKLARKYAARPPFVDLANKTRSPDGLPKNEMQARERLLNGARRGDQASVDRLWIEYRCRLIR